MATKLDARQVISRDVLDQIAATGAELDNILRSINSNDTAPLSLSVAGTNRIVNIGSIFVTNPETNKNKTIPTISNVLPAFTSGTVTAPATGSGTITVSAGTSLVIAMTSSQFLKIGINIDNLGNISLTAGTAGASLAAATAPAAVANTFSPGYVVLRTDGSNNMANILSSDLYQYVGGGGGGSGSSSSTEIVQANTFSVGNLVYLNGSTYTLARADSANTASVVGMVSVASSTRFTIVTSGLVTGLTGLTVGADYFLDGVTAGLATTADPTTIGYVSAPIGIAASATSMYIAIKRGVVVGTSNVFNNITLANNAATTIQNISSFANGEGGILTGTIKIDATTDYTFGFEISFTKDTAGVINHSARYFAGDIPTLALFSVGVSGQNIQITLGSHTGFVAASARFQLSASAVSPVLTTVSGSGVNELPQKNYLKDYYDASGTLPSVSTLASTTSNLVSLTAFYADSTSGASALTINASTLLRGSANYLTATGTSNATGARFVQFPAFALEGTDLGKPISISFDVTGVTTDGNWDAVIVRYNSSGVYQNTLSIAGNVSSASAFPSAKLPTGTTTFNGFFVPDSTTASDIYALRLRSLANTVQIRVDTLFVGPQPIRVGNARTGRQSYTPTGPYTGTTTYTGFWSRDNEDILLDIDIEFSGAPTGTNALFTYAQLLNGLGLTVDTTKLPNLALSSPPCGTWSINDSGTAIYNGAATLNGANGQVELYSAAGVLVTKTAPLTIGAGDNMSMSIRLPITGWSSNVTMADRSVEEYLWNSATADSTDTSSFGYGPAGVLFGSFTTSTRRKRIRSTTTIQPTDQLIIEVQPSGTNAWYPHYAHTNGSFLYTPQNATVYGIYLETVSATDIDVSFAPYARATGVTYGSAGEAWSTYSTWRWRVRKVSGGAQVGYPISSANIVGRVDGNAPATGMVGEKIEATISTTSATTSEADITGASLALTKGSWEIKYSVTANYTTGATSANAGYTIVGITDSSNTHIGRSDRMVFCKTVAAVANVAYTSLSASTVVDISADTTYKLRLKRVDTAGTGTGGVEVSTGIFDCTFYAIRKA